MESKKQIEIALRAAMVAKSALQMIEGREGIVLRLCAQDLAEKVGELLKVVDAATNVSSPPVPPHN